MTDSYVDIDGRRGSDTRRGRLHVRVHEGVSDGGAPVVSLHEGLERMVASRRDLFAADTAVRVTP